MYMYGHGTALLNTLLIYRAVRTKRAFSALQRVNPPAKRPSEGREPGESHPQEPPSPEDPGAAM